MGGSKSQTVGYKYFKGLMAVIGNPIERFLGINPDKKGWLMASDQDPNENFGRTGMSINQPNLFGGDKKEGGWVGNIDIYAGRDYQKQNEYLAEHIGGDVSAYPNLSYLVFRGYNADSLEPSLDKGFQLVSMSGMMKEFMIWVKRIHIKNNGSGQWHDQKAEVPEREAAKGDNQEPTYVLKTKWWRKDGDLETQLNPTIENVQGYTVGFDKPPLVASVDIGLRAEFKFNKPIRGTINLRVSNTNNSKFYVTSGQTIDFIGVDPEDETLDLYDVYCYGDIDVNFKIDSTMPNISSFGIHLSSIIKVKPSKWKYKYNIGDMNPVHKIREILTDYTAMSKPESDINNQNFQVSADRIWEECLGISWCVQQKSCKEALEELEYHIEGGVRINRQTGLYEVILFRDDLLNLDDALHFDESNIKSFQPDIINAEDQINAANVSFYDRENIKDSSFSLSDVGSFHTIDHENAEDLKFPYFMNRRNAEMVANWKLKQLSTMAWKGTFTTGKYEARKLNKYDVILLSWKSKNIINLPVRVMNINLGNGRDNTVTLDFVEVVPYSNISYSSINVDPNPNPILPPQPNSSIVFEMPYFEAVQRMGQTSVDTELANNPEIGYLMAAAIKPQNNSLNALLYTDGGSNTLDLLEEGGVVEYCAACTLDQTISRTDESFAVKSVNDLSRVKPGTLVQVDEELLVYENYDAEAKILTVKRGALDTIPKPHLENAVLYFWDDSSGLDQTVYVDGETIHAKVLTTTPSGVENLGTSAVRILEIKGRANRPYPPANIKINGIYYPESTIVSNNIDVIWVDRNRLQQTGGNILGFYDEGVTRESDVTYSIELLSENVVLYSANNITSNSHTIPASVLIQNKPHKFKIWSVRGGLESYQAFEHNFFVEAVSLILTATAFKDKVVGSTVPVANINIVVDETLTANMKFDGSSIKGKALPNSNITIEVDE